VKHKIGVEGVGGLIVAVQGLGSVGYDLARRLKKHGAQLIVADINEAATQKAADELKATVVSVDEIHAQEADIFAPCALMARDILYCPDYVLNAGGIINVAAEVSGTYDYDWVDGKLENLRGTLSKVFEAADKAKRPTNEIADEMARQRLGLV